MASTCNDCGRSTWGRYRICPDCRKDRKRKGSYRGYSGYRDSGSGERYVCNLCKYRWRSKKSFGSPAFCPNCRKDDIIPYSETPAGKRETIIMIIFIVGIIVVLFVFMGSLSNLSNYFEVEGANSAQAKAKQYELECLSNNGLYYSQTCTPIQSIQNERDLCNSVGKKLISFGGGKFYCYKGKIESDELSESQKIEVLNCENLGNVPVITDKVNCIDLDSSPKNSNEKTISPEKELINYCISQFSNEGVFDLIKIIHLENFSSASDWIRNNYENSALTQEQREHNINSIIENQLPEQGYPLVITYGSKQIDSQLTSKGYYFCNKEGII